MINIPKPPVEVLRPQDGTLSLAEQEERNAFVHWLQTLNYEGLKNLKWSCPKKPTFADWQTRVINREWVRCLRLQQLGTCIW